MIPTSMALGMFIIGLLLLGVSIYFAGKALKEDFDDNQTEDKTSHDPKRD